LFGYVNAAGTVKNLNLVNSNVSGRNQVGSVVGSNNGDISNFTNSGTVSGEDYVGGVAGRNNGTISYSTNSGSVSGNKSAGGIVGIQFGSSISYCTNSGSVNGNKFAGGIVGILSNGNLLYCTNSGSISGYGAVGCVAGTAGNASVSFCYYDKQMCSLGGVSGSDAIYRTKGKLTSEMTGELLKTGDTGKGFTKEHWVFSEGLYPILKGLDTTDAAIVDASPVFLKDSQTVNNVTNDFKVGIGNGVTWERQGSGRPLNISDIANGNVSINEIGVDTLVAKKNGVVYKTVVLIVPNLKTNPITIDNEEELQEFRDGINTGSSFLFKEYKIPPGGKSIYFKLTADIDLKSVCYKVDGTEKNDKSWTPIGDTLKSFQGSFDGDGHTISSLYINVSSANYQGLFGYVYAAGTVKNLNLVNSNVSGRNQVGSVAGSNNGDISNCTNSGSISGKDYVGGVAGLNDGNLSYSTNSGSVSGRNYVGGVTGYNAYNGIFSYCTNSGSVSGPGNYVGGVVGFNDGYLSYSTNSGSVSGTEYSHYYVGGVAGSNHKTISNSTNSGSVSGEYYVGGVAGENNRTISNSTNSGSVSGKNYVGGVTGKNDMVISNSTNSGSVSGKDYVGGVVGLNDGNLSYSTNSGSVSGTGNDVGGVAGYNAYNGIFNSIISYCINSGSVTGDSTYVGGIVGASHYTKIISCYYDKQMSTVGGMDNNDVENSAVGKLTTEMTSIELKTSDTGDGFTKEHWVFTEGLYPIPKGLENSDAAIVAATPIFLSNEENYSSVTTDFKVSTDNDVVWTAEPQTSVTIKNDGSFKLIKQGEVTLYAEKNGVIYKSVILNPIKTNGFEIVKQNFVVPYLRSTTEGIQIDFGSKPQTLIIYSQDGKQKFKQTSIGKTYIDLSSFGTGNYIVRVNNQVYRMVKK